MIEKIDELADETLNEDGACCSDTNCCPLKLQLYEILQRLGVTILVFVATDANLRNVVEKTFKSKVFI